MIISNSDRTCFKFCRRKWDFGSPNRMNLRVKQKQGPLWLGSLIHNCLEDFYGGVHKDTYEAFQKWSAEISQGEKLEYADELSMAHTMALHYALYKPSLEYEDFTPLHVEMPFQIPLDSKGNIFAGTIDGIVRLLDGRIAILEHKTFSRHKDKRMHAIDDQTSIYPAALNMLIKQGKVPGTTPDDHCDTVIYNGLWKKIPPSVKIDPKSGLTARSLGITTPEWVEYKIKKLGKNPKNFLDNLKTLEHNREKYFPRFYIHRGEDEQKLAVNRLLAEFGEMSKEDVVIYHNPSTECTWKCEFLPLCEAANSGACTKSIIETMYEQAPNRGAAYKQGE